MNLFKRKKPKHQYSVQDHFNQVVNELNPPRTKNYMEIKEEEERLEKEKEESDTQWKAFIEDERESSKHVEKPFISIHTDTFYKNCDVSPNYPFDNEPVGDTRYNTPKEKHKASTEDILQTIETTEIYRKAKERILKAQQGQVGYGLDKYPEPLNADTWTIFETLDHAMDESVDRMHYFEMLRIKFEEMVKEINLLKGYKMGAEQELGELRAFKKMIEEREVVYADNEPVAFIQDLSGADQDGDYTYPSYEKTSKGISDMDKQLKKLSKQIDKTRSYLKLNSLEETLNEKL